MAERVGEEPGEEKHACMRCGSHEWEYVDYGGCSVCRPHEERVMEEEPERLRALRHDAEISAGRRHSDGYALSSMSYAEGVLWLLAEVARLARRETQLSGWYNDAERKITELKGEVERLARDNEQLRDTQGRVQKTADTLFARAGDLEARVERLAGERDGLLDVVERLNTTIGRLSNAEKGRDEVRRDLKRTEAECEQLDEERDRAVEEARAAVPLINEKVRERDEARAECERLAERNELLAHVAEVRLDRCERLAGRVAAYETAMQAMWGKNWHHTLELLSECSIPADVGGSESDREALSAPEMRELLGTFLRWWLMFPARPLADLQDREERDKRVMEGIDEFVNSRCPSRGSGG